MAAEIQLYKGSFFNFDDIENNIVTIEDIAHSLSNQCRWSGHTLFHYSVAQHLCYCCDAAYEKYQSDQWAYECLMHDAPESVMVDLPRPLKRILSGYTELNDRIETFFGKKFHYTHPMPKEVQLIDDAMLITEYQQVVDAVSQSHHPTFTNFYVEPLNIEIEVWSHGRAENEFLDRYFEYRH